MAQPLLSDLLIEGYRGLRRVELKKLGNVNLIVGQNGVGKTSVLEAVRLYASNAALDVLADIFRSRGDRAQVDPLQPFLDSEMNSLFHGFQNKSATPPAIKIGLSSAPRVMSLVWVRQVRDSFGNYVPQFDGDNATEFTDGSLRALLVRQLGLNLRLVTFEKVPFLFGLPRNDFKEGGAIQDEVVFLGSHGIDEEQFGPYWDKMVRAGLEDDLIAALRNVNPNISRAWMMGVAGTTERRLEVRLGSNEGLVPLRRLGEGMYRFLAIICALVSAKDGFLLIDEFENGLHFKTQEALWKFVIRTARELNVQIFATTHSRDCIGAFGRAATADRQSDGILTKLEQVGDDVVAKQLYEDDIVLASENLVEIR